MELTLAIFLTRAVVSASGASAEQREGSLRSKRLAKAVGSKCFRTRICPDTTEVSAKYEAERESSPGRYARAPVDSRAAPAEALGDAPAARWRYPKLMRSNLGSCMRDSILLNRRPACDHTRTLQRTADEQLQRQLGASRGCQHHDLHGCHRGLLLSLAEHHDARLNSVIYSLGVINTKAGAKRLARRSVQRVERESQQALALFAAPSRPQMDESGIVETNGGVTVRLRVDLCTVHDECKRRRGPCKSEPFAPLLTAVVD